MTERPEVSYVEVEGRTILIRPLDTARDVTADEQYGAYLYWQLAAHPGARPMSFDRWKRKSGL